MSLRHLTLLSLGRDNENVFGVLPSANAGVTQLVECDLAKVDVAGSNPVSRSNLLLSCLIRTALSQQRTVRAREA